MAAVLAALARAPARSRTLAAAAGGRAATLLPGRARTRGGRVGPLPFTPTFRGAQSTATSRQGPWRRWASSEAAPEAEEPGAAGAPPSPTSGGNAVGADPPLRDKHPAPSRDEWYGRDAGSKTKTRVVTGGAADLDEKRHAAAEGIQGLPEVRQYERFLAELEAATARSGAEGGAAADLCRIDLGELGIGADEFRRALTAGLATLCLQVESRVAAFLGEGFYTIGSSGEEALAAVGCVLQGNDSTALHYRHLATQIARQLTAGEDLDAVLLARARAHVVSAQDPVTGGAHCAIGGGPHDYIVTSTLASQATPAVGRALGVSLAESLGLPCNHGKGFISYVSAGDGSINNAHWLSAVNLAMYAFHRHFRVPVLFAVSDNDLCISLRGFGWVQKYTAGLGMPVYTARGDDLLDVWQATRRAAAECRKRQCPVMLVFSDVPRRFGHAATDRQHAYLSSEEIDQFENHNPLAAACAQATAAGVCTPAELRDELQDVRARARRAFDAAAAEAKIARRSDVLARVAQDLVPTQLPNPHIPRTSKAPVVMRKNMTAVLDELLASEPGCVYLGEDVTHGGYYLVTEGLEAKYSHRVRDFPPDETSLLGAAVGFAQVGLTPIVEIPYAKYLDCGADMFFELALNNWLSNGQQPNGMIIRLQGFGPGVFGGNFHTHNALHLPPGIDVVCYSNGADYVRGWRYAFQQAKAGRVVMSVDATDLLNRRHLHGGDEAWKRAYPGPAESLAFDDVVTYGDSTDADVCLVAYGNTVVESLVAAKTLAEEAGVRATVVDVPCISHVPAGLYPALRSRRAVVFADPCKQGQNPFGNFVTTLQAQGELPERWQSVAALPAYNPLGTTLTFTSAADIVAATHKVL